MSATTVITGRLGRDAVLRDAGSTKVINLALAVNYGYGDKKGTQWYDIAVFGKQAEALVQWAVKGSIWCVSVKDLHIEPAKGEYQAKLVGVALDVNFAPQQKSNDDPAPKPKQKTQPVDDDLNSDVPF
jgi:single-strand DNA-binding protein